MPRSSKITLEAVRFGAIIRRLRLARGWTAVKLAQRAGMNPRYLGVLEQGGNDTSLTTIVELCDVLNADIGEVMREVASVRNPTRPVVTTTS
ncbi:MAG TPA: helix-turn-helix transcriptional regulator [Thermoanaerobaculia bacterium]|nr:helix-turn-helix transcriptional regulator [Thermoanaerobaculia bacterium]